MAGRWNKLTKRLTIDSLTKEVQSPIGYVYEFEAGADGSIPALPINDISGFLCGMDFIVDGTTPPNSATISIQTIDELERAAAILTDSGFVVPTEGQYVPFAGGLNVAISGNTTAYAKGKIVVLVA